MTAKAKGKKMVAWTAAKDWFMPMKKNENAEVEGKPPRIPPMTLPFFSAITVIAVTQQAADCECQKKMQNQ